jgi:hypothetical protein
VKLTQKHINGVIGSSLLAGTGTGGVFLHCQAGVSRLFDLGDYFKIVYYNQVAAQMLAAGAVRLSYAGNSGASYALEHTFNLSPANWVPLATNSAGSSGFLEFTNIPNATTNNYWRIRSVP